MTALDDLKEYMGTTLVPAYSDGVLLGVLETETADQASRIRPTYRQAATWADHKAPLREALLRRCVRNLALRKLPLGISESDIAALRVAGRDTEIKRLEAPYLRMVVG